MINGVKRIRLNMLTWLGLPVVLVALLSTQLYHAVDLFASSPQDLAGINAEAESATKLPPIPEFKYQNTGLVTIWFDDAWRSQYDIGLPILDKFGYKAALAVPTSIVGSYNYMDWLQVKKLQHSGWEITAHSRTHNCDMEKANQTQVNFEVVGSLQDLQKRQIRRDIYVTPCGVENPLIEQTVKLNYPVALRTSNQGMNQIPVPDRYDLVVMAVRNNTTKKDVEKWLQQAKAEKKWIILMFHRLDDDRMEYDTDQKTYEEVIEAVHASGLPVVLPTQVLSLKGTGTGSTSGPLPVEKQSVDPVLIPAETNQPDPTDEPQNNNGDTSNDSSVSNEPEGTPSPSDDPEPSDEPSSTPEPSSQPTPEPSSILEDLPI